MTMVMSISPFRTKSSGLYRHRGDLGLHKVGYKERNLHIRSPSLPSMPRHSGRGKKGGERKGRGTGPLPNSDWAWGGMPSSWPSPLSSTKAHVGLLSPRGVQVTPPPGYSRKCPNLSKTFPVSKYSLPIYQSLCLDHFETPHHVVIISGTPN